MPEKSPLMILMEGTLKSLSKLHPPESLFGNLDKLTDDKLDAETKRLVLKLGLDREEK